MNIFEALSSLTYIGRLFLAVFPHFQYQLKMNLNLKKAPFSQHFFNLGTENGLKSDVKLSNELKKNCLGPTCYG